MRKTLSILAALVVSASSAAAAHADTITGGFSAFGSDTFTSNSITIDSATVFPTISGTFAQYVPVGTSLTFPAGNVLPYNSGVMLTPPPATYPNGYVPLFAISGNGETFTFDMTSYTANYVSETVSGTAQSSVTVLGSGYFSETGTVSGVSAPATFQFTLQEVAGAPSPYSFSATTSVSATPEPSSLALLGTGLLGAVGVCRRKFAL